MTIRNTAVHDYNEMIIWHPVLVRNEMVPGGEPIIRDLYTNIGDCMVNIYKMQTYNFGMLITGRALRVMSNLLLNGSFDNDGN